MQNHKNELAEILSDYRVHWLPNTLICYMHTQHYAW